MKFSILSFKFLRTRGGFTLVETLVAISIFTVSILGLVAVISDGVVSTRYAKQKIAASYLAQEGIEYVRNIRDREILYGQGNIGIRWGRFKDNLNIGSEIPPPSDTNFTRTISKIIVSQDQVKIFSKVEWTQGSGAYNITFSENLFNWIE